jgi:hypothetical protein
MMRPCQDNRYVSAQDGNNSAPNQQIPALEAAIGTGLRAGNN